MRYIFAFLIFLFATTLFAQTRLTGKSLTQGLFDYGDPTIPEVLPTGEIRVLTTNGIVLFWTSKQSFFEAHSPRVEFLKVHHPDGTPFNEELGEDLWDPSFAPGDEILYAGVMTPAPGQKHARWPEDHWSRRVYAFKKINGRYIRETNPLFHSVNRQSSWLNHGYGHQFLNGYAFYERVTEEKDGTPFKTEIFIKKMISPLLADKKEIPVLSVPERPWKKSLRSFGGSLLEGPRPFVKDGVYYISFSAGDYDSDDYGIHLARSQSITGPYTPYLSRGDLKSFESPFEKSHPMTWGAGRGSFFEMDGKWWVIFHGTDSFGTEGFRDLFVSPVSVSTSGIKIL